MKKPSKLSKSKNSSYDEMSIDDLGEILNSTIKFDWENKIITFLCMLSASTYEDQFNISFNGSSSSGKTYIVKECAEYFGDDYKVELSGASPNSFFYGRGTEDKEREAKIISLHRKIMLFYEMPNPLLQEKLRPVLSHDHWENKHQLTNKSGKNGANKTELVIITGFPAAIFCSAALRLDMQETTRSILLSPEINQEKIAASLKLQSLRGSNKVDYIDYLMSDPRRKELKERVAAIRDWNSLTIIIPDEVSIRERFEAMQPKLKERHSRDLAHLQQLIKSITLLNIWHRVAEDGAVSASQADVDAGFRLWEKIAIYQDLGVSPVAIQFYKKYILPAWKKKNEEQADYQLIAEGQKMGLSRNELGLYYLDLEGSMMPEIYVRKQILPQLENSGIVTQEKPASGDKRSMHIFPQWFPDEQNNVGKGVEEDLENEFVDPFDN